MTVTSQPTYTYREAVERLGALQKTSKGAPAYSRYVNRWAGRRLAAAAYVLRLTPNQVTAVSALLTYSGIAVIAFVPPTLLSGVLVSVLLLVGYMLDSADGQLSRLQGSGSAAGEWLDHVVDAGKIGLLHVAVFLCWSWRYEDLDSRLLLVPIGYLVVQFVFYFTTMLTDALRRANRGINRNILGGEGTSSLAYSLMVLPTDYGLLCFAFVLLAWPAAFVTVYGLFFLAAAGFLLLALPKWYLEMRSFGSRS